MEEDEGEEEPTSPHGPSAARRLKTSKKKKETIDEKEAIPAKKKRPEPDSEDEDKPRPSRSSGPVLPVALDSNAPPTDEEAEDEEALDSEDTVSYPVDNTGDALLIIDEAD